MRLDHRGSLENLTVLIAENVVDTPANEEEELEAKIPEREVFVHPAKNK